MDAAFNPPLNERGEDCAVPRGILKEKQLSHMGIRITGRTSWSAFALVGLAALLPLAAACGDTKTTPTQTTTAPTNQSATAVATNGSSPGAIPADVGKNDHAQLTGAGATFPQPIYQAWFDDYNAKVASGVQVNYQGAGSGAGVQQFTTKTVDFGASDVGMTDAQITAAGGADKVQLVPTVIGAVVLSYNLPGVSQPLKLDGATVANIYLGSIKKWDDPALKALNPGVLLPNKDIVVVYRADSSGTSGVFTDYLSKVSADWKSKVGSGTAPNWPVGQGGQGNPGVANLVKNTPNSIGYVELTYALQNKLSFADLENSAGKFVKASIASASAAAAGVTLPDDYRVSLTNATGADAYPIATFTYLLLYKQDGKCSTQRPLANLLWWAYNDSGAQATVKELDYAPLPAELVSRVDTTLRSLKCDGGAKASLGGT